MVEASAILEEDRRELFMYTDWCYNVPEWFQGITEARILRLPDSNGLGKITRYKGTIFGREMEWDAQSVEWKEDNIWKMMASTGLPAKMNMFLLFQFEDIGVGRTRVRGAMGFHAPYPIIGALMDRFYLRSEAQRMVTDAVEGVKQAAVEHRIPSANSQLEKRKTDHLGYSDSQITSQELHA